jgi:hypothetical protein
MTDIVIQVESTEEPFADYAGDFGRILCGLVIKGDRLAKRVHDDVTIPTFLEVLFDLCAQLLIEFPINVVGEVTQQMLAFGMIVFGHASLLSCLFGKALIEIGAQVFPQP